MNNRPGEALVSFHTGLGLIIPVHLMASEEELIHPEIVKDIGTDRRATFGNVIAFKNMVFFTAKGLGLGLNWWTINNQGNTASLLKDIQPGDMGSNPQNLIATEHLLFFGQSYHRRARLRIMGY